MDFRDSVELVAGVPLLVVVPALVELAKRGGMSNRYAGVAAITLATGLLTLGDLALGGLPAGEPGGWAGRLRAGCWAAWSTGWPPPVCTPNDRSCCRVNQGRIRLPIRNAQVVDAAGGHGVRLHQKMPSISAPTSVSTSIQ